MKDQGNNKIFLKILSLFVAYSQISAAADGFFDNLTAGVDSNSYGLIEVKLGGLILGKGTYNLSPTLPSGVPYQGAGTRMLWYPRMAAFRAGYVSGTQWNSTSLGAYSAAFGNNATASGAGSFATGGNVLASGLMAVAFGNQTTASGQSASAMGASTLASGWSATAMGANTVASGNSATATGKYTYATGESSTATGYGTGAIEFGSTASGVGSYSYGSSSMAAGESCVTDGYASFAAGMGSWAAGEASVALGCSSALNMFCFATGRSVALGHLSTAMGSTFTESAYSTSIGFNNVGGGDSYGWIPSDPLFEIGNGDPDTDSRSNAVTVYKNGNMDVQGAITCAPGGDIPMFGE